MTRLEPTGRFEWERIVRRCRLPNPVKYLAFVLATYADRDGSRVRPGQGVLAAVTNQSDRNVRRYLSELVRLGLVVVVSRGGGRGRGGHTSTYRLTIPDDLLDRVELLPPSEERSRSPSDSEDGQMSAQFDVSPVDNPDREDTTMSGHSNGHAVIDRTSANGSTSIDRTKALD